MYKSEILDGFPCIGFLNYILDFDPCLGCFSEGDFADDVLMWNTCVGSGLSSH